MPSSVTRDDHVGRRRRRPRRRARRSVSRAALGIARRPLVARFQTICRICASSAWNHTGSGGTSHGDAVRLEHARGCSAAACAVSVSDLPTSSLRDATAAAAARRRGSCGSSRSAARTRAARCPSAATARRSAAAPAAGSGSSPTSTPAGCGSRARSRPPSRRPRPAAAGCALRAQLPRLRHVLEREDEPGLAARRASAAPC